MNYFAGEFVFSGQADIASVKKMSIDSRLNNLQEFVSADGSCVIFYSSRLEKIHSEKSAERSAAFYDDSSQYLTLACDSIGREAVFYSITGNRIIFANDLKAILNHPNFVKKVDYKTITSFISTTYNNKPFAVYKNIYSLQPRNIAKIDSNGHLEIAPYKLSADVFGDHKLSDNQSQLAKKAKNEICQAVAEEISSAAQAGLLLSGGFNSAVLLAAICQSCPAEKVKTFTVSFEGSKSNQTSAARKLAKYFGTNHTELKVSADPKGLIDWITENYDQPFADPATIKTFLISQAVKEYATSAISGEGGKLVFADYQRYHWLNKAENLGSVKSSAYRLVSSIVNILAPINEQNKFRQFAKFAKILSLVPAERYFILQSLFTPMDLLKIMNPSLLAEHEIYVDDPFEWFCELFEQGDCKDIITRTQLMDIQTYLSDNILTRTNTTSKATGMEIRLPFINKELIKLGLNLPANIKSGYRQKESILYKAFKDILPADVSYQKDQPLKLPLAGWLRKELRRDMLETLTDQKFQDMEIFYPPALAALVNEHLCKQADHSHRLWAITILARWLIKNG